MRNSIKQLFIVVLTTVALTMHARGEEQGKFLFILSGQSNMSRLDPSISFTPTVIKEFGKNNVVVVKDAQDGRPIRRWYKQWKPEKGDEPNAIGDLYDRLMTSVNTAIKDKRIKAVTFIWMQGETDAAEMHGDNYAASLSGLLDQLREDFVCKEFYFVIGRLSDYDLSNKIYPHWTMVRKAQVEVAEASPHGRWIDTDDLNGNKNDLHYTKLRGYRALGKRFAESAIELIRRNDEQDTALDADKLHC